MSYLFLSNFLMSSDIFSKTLFDTHVRKWEQEDEQEIVKIKWQASLRDCQAAQLRRPHSEDFLRMLVTDYSQFKSFFHYLLIHEVHIDEVRDSKAHTLLHYAVYYNPRAIRCLYKQGANLYAQNEAGQTPLDYACEGYKIHAIKLLSQCEKL